MAVLCVLDNKDKNYIKIIHKKSKTYSHSVLEIGLFTINMWQTNHSQRKHTLL